MAGSRPPSSLSGRRLPATAPHRLSLEPLEEGRIVSPFAGLRPLAVAPDLPPMVPTAWDHDRDDPTAFQAPSFETIGKPIRLKFCKEWYETVFGAAAKSIPDLLDANNWLPPNTPVKLKLPGKLRQKMGLEQAESPPLSVASCSTPDGLNGLNGTKRRPSGRTGRRQSRRLSRRPSDLIEIAEVVVEKDERHWAAVQLQCMARCWRARAVMAKRRRQMRAQTRIASCFRGHLTRTDRKDLVKPVTIKKEPTQPPLLPQLASLKLDPAQEEVDLRHLHLGEETHQLVPVMHHLQCLVSLELMGNYVASKGLFPLVKILQKQPKLQYLGLSWNGIGDDGCKHLVKIVQSNLKLQHLDLRYNRIGDMGAQTLSRSLKEHGMQILDLQDNAICRLGAEMLYANCGRRLRLKLSCNSVPSYQLVELEEQLEARREEERQLKEAQMKAGKGKKNRPASGQSKTALSKPGSQQSKSSKESKPSSSQRRMSRAPSMGTLSEMS